MWTKLAWTLMRFTTEFPYGISRRNQQIWSYFDSYPWYRFSDVWNVCWVWLEAASAQTSAMMSKWKPFSSNDHGNQGIYVLRHLRCTEVNYIQIQPLNQVWVGSGGHVQNCVTISTKLCQNFYKTMFRFIQNYVPIYWTGPTHAKFMTIKTQCASITFNDC